MQCRLFSYCLLIIFVAVVVRVESSSSYFNNFGHSSYRHNYDASNNNDDGHVPEEKTMYNRMICENEKLQIECKTPNHVLNIQRAYYGRYSITPCNKNHLKFAKGCTANNTIHIIKKLCEGKPSCNQKITTSLFKYDPCPGVDKVLEINYYCVFHKKSKHNHKVKTKPVPTQQISTSILTSSSIIPSTTELASTNKLTDYVPNLFTTTPITTLELVQSKSTQLITESKKTTDPIQLISQTDDSLNYLHQSLSSSDDLMPAKKCYFSQNNLTKPYLTDAYSDYSADLNQYISLPCSTHQSNKGSSYYKCQSDGQFHYVNSTCDINTLNNYQLEDIMVKNNIIENTKLEQLVDFIKNASLKIVSDVNQVKANSQNVSNIIINAVDKLISKNEKWKELSQEEKSKSVTKLFDTVDTVVFEKKLSSNQDILDSNNFLINTENIIAEVSNNGKLKKKIKFPTLVDNSETTENVVLTLSQPKKSQVFMFMVYKSVNDFLVSIKQPEESTSDESSLNKTNQSNQIINSNIISFKMNEKEDINYLKIEPIELTFKHLIESDNPDAIKPTCSYWNYNRETFDGHWSSDGCSLEFTNKSHSICKCNHLTHFAILIDIQGVHQHYSNIHKTILSAITIVFSSISCICIILTLLAFRFVKIIKKNREQSTTKDLTVITTHLCLCLLASLSIFLIGIGVKQLRHKELCSVIGVLSHYFFLSAFFWMLLEGVQLYLMLVHIFTLKNSPIKKFCLIAYGIPFIIVTCSKLIDYYYLDSLGYGTSDHCWLSTHYNFNLLFIIPITLILLANFIILIIVISGMRNSMASRQVHNKKQDDFFKSLLGFWCIIMTLLGLPWVIGYLIIDSKQTIVFSYLFTIINTSQGTIVFIFHCIVSKNVREELLKSLRKQKHRILKSTSSSGSAFSNTKLTNNQIRSSKNLQRTTSDSSSFRTLKKSYDSARLLDRKSSNCSNMNKNSLFTDSLNNDNSMRLCRNSVHHHFHHEQADNENKKPFFNYLISFICSSVDKQKKNKTSNSFSYSSRSCTDTNTSPLQNYSPNSSSPFNSNYVKICSNDNDNETFIKLLNNEPYQQFYNTNNYKIQQKPPIYLANESNLVSVFPKRNSGSMKMNCRLVNNANVRRTLSQMSNDSSTKQKTSLTSTPIINGTSTQIPTIPPPPLPIGVYGTSSTVATPQLPNQKIPILSRKNTLNESRLSTFKSSSGDKNRLETSTTTLEKPIITNNILANKRLAAYDENQYLTPEYHSYSMVDSEFQSEYYCDDGICSVGVEDEMSNNYQEVIDHEYESETVIPSNAATIAATVYTPYSNNFNKRFKNSSMDSRNHKSKLKDLITMPEELDKEYSIENSNVSESSIFKGVSSENSKTSLKFLRIDTNNKKEPLDKIPSVSNCSVAHLSSFNSSSSDTGTGTSSNTTLSQSPTLISNNISNNNNVNEIDPNENSIAKKILQRI